MFNVTTAPFLVAAVHVYYRYLGRVRYFPVVSMIHTFTSHCRRGKSADDKRARRNAATVLLLLGLLLVTQFGFAKPAARAQSSTQPADDQMAQRRVQLQQQLDLLEKEIQAQQVLLDQKHGESTSLERDVTIFDAKIKKAQLAIKARELTIQQLTNEISDKQSTIGELNDKIQRERESLAQLVRSTAEKDDISLVEIILGNDSLSQFFSELDDAQSLKTALRSSFDVIASTEKATLAAKGVLENKHSEEVDLKTIQALEEQQTKAQQQEKQKLLAVTKGEEQEYKQVINQNKQTAAQIRAALFELRGSAAIPFGKALEYANFASKKTGVRPALILGILKQETSLGEFLGNGVWTQDMHPTRDRPLFKVITASLGLDPDKMPVSKQPSYGWGGAMGPGQFIPSTWACLGGFTNTRTGDCSNSSRSITMSDFWSGPWVYSQGTDRVRALVGKNGPSNPWDNQDAFMATAILMQDNGANRGDRASERLAALRYFAGWGNANNPSYAFYGDNVMDHADYYQQQIDTLTQLGS